MAYRRIVRTKKLAASTLKEIGSYLGAGALYPLGLFERTAKSRRHSKSCPNTRPVILVHGIIHNRSAFLTLGGKLEQLCWENIYSFNYNTFTGGIFQMVEELALRVDKILETTGVHEVDVIAHSLGGIVARTFMTVGSGRGKVRRLVTLGTPHQGTNLSFIARGLNIGTLARDLRPGSYLIDLLRHTALPKRSTITSIYSPFDWTCVPGENGAAIGNPEESIRNVRLDGVGHAGLLFSQEAFDVVVQSLTGADKSLKRKNKSREGVHKATGKLKTSGLRSLRPRTV